MYNNFCDTVLPFHSINYAAMVDVIFVAVVGCLLMFVLLVQKTKRKLLLIYQQASFYVSFILFILFHTPKMCKFNKKQILQHLLWFCWWWWCCAWWWWWLWCCGCAWCGACWCGACCCGCGFWCDNCCCWWWLCDGGGGGLDECFIIGISVSTVNKKRIKKLRLIQLQNNWFFVKRLFE